MLQDITFQPGIRKDTTEYLAEGGWVDCDKIRFKNSIVSKIGGWVSETVFQYHKKGAFSSAFSSAFSNSTDNSRFTGSVREMLSWTALDSTKYLATGSEQKVEILQNGVIYDITPVKETANLTNAITTYTPEFDSAFSSAFSLYNTTLVKITDENHGLSAGDWIDVISQASSVGGITLSGKYQVHTVIDFDNYFIDAKTYPTAAETLAGGALQIDYLLGTGFASNKGYTGWGGGTWNTPGDSGQGWNRPRAGVGDSNLRLWSFDEWGEDLVACVKGGPIYHWDETNGVSTRLQALSNAPSENTMILVSAPSRHLIAFGSEVESTSAFDPLIIRWASQETLNTWATSSSNTAGEYRLPKGNRIVTAVQTRSEIIVFTETTVYSMRYVGGTNVFAFTPLGGNISIASQNSVIDVNGVIMWMGKDGFYVYDGVIRRLPCSVRKFIFDQESEGKLNFSQKEKVYVGINREFDEVWWFYPSGNTEENDRYVKVNYQEGVWDIGTMERLAWLDRSVFEKPYGIDSDGVLYVHEEGVDADSSPMLSYITSGYFDIGDGDDIMFVDRIIPDLRLDTNKNIEISVLVKNYPHPTEAVTTKGPYYFDNADNKIDMRARGRQMAIKYQSNVTGGDFEIGKVRVNMKADGKR